jgi:hypothetical protein
MVQRLPESNRPSRRANLHPRRDRKPLKLHRLIHTENFLQNTKTRNPLAAVRLGCYPPYLHRLRHVCATALSAGRTSAGRIPVGIITRPMNQPAASAPKTVPLAPRLHHVILPDLQYGAAHLYVQAIQAIIAVQMIAACRAHHVLAFRPTNPGGLFLSSSANSTFPSLRRRRKTPPDNCCVCVPDRTGLE